MTGTDTRTPSPPVEPPRISPVTTGRVSRTAERPALPDETPAALAYAAAVAGPFVALGVTLLLSAWLGPVLFVFFWPVVIAIAAWAGRGPAFLASLLSVAIVDWFLLAPIGEISLLETANLIPALSFVGASTLVSAIADRQRKARRQAAEVALTNAEMAAELQDQAARLEEQAAELEQHMEEAQSLGEELEHTNEELLGRTEEAERNEKRTRSILEGITDPFVVYDDEWRFRYINAAAAAVFASAGSSAAAVEGKVLWELYPGMRGTDVERVLRRAGEERRGVEAESFLPEQGTWSHVSAFPLADGGVAAQWRDITARKRAEEAAHYLSRASAVLGSSLDYERTLRDLANLLVPDLGDWAGVDLIGPDGRRQQVAVAHVNPAKLEFVRELNERYPPDDEAPTGAMNVIRTGQPELYPEIPEGMLEAAARDTEHLRLIRELSLRSAMVVPLRAGDRTIGALSIVSAESRRRYSEKDLELAMELGRRAALAVEHARLHREAVDARARAEEANRAKTQFLTVMSHELRTPLNAISGYAELMSLGIRGPITAEQKADLERIARSQRHLLALINDVLNYARLEGGHVEYQLESVAVRELLDDIETLVRPQILDKQLRFDVQPVGDALTVTADREKARQVLLNLLSNAVKFTPHGGSILVEADRHDGQVRIHVRDSGVGIPSDKLEAIFEPFVQVGRTLTTPSEGTGLGLSISRDLARGMHGELTAQSTLGMGSTFTLALPPG